MRKRVSYRAVGLSAMLIAGIAPVPAWCGGGQARAAPAPLAVLEPVRAQSLCVRRQIAGRYHFGGYLPDGRPCPAGLPKSCPRAPSLPLLDAEFELLGASRSSGDPQAGNAAGEGVLGGLEIGPTLGTLACDQSSPEGYVCVRTDAPARDCRADLEFDLGAAGAIAPEHIALAVLEVHGLNLAGEAELAAGVGGAPSETVGRRAISGWFVSTTVVLGADSLARIRTAAGADGPRRVLVTLAMSPDPTATGVFIAEDRRGAFFGDPARSGRTRLVLSRAAPPPPLP